MVCGGERAESVRAPEDEETYNLRRSLSVRMVHFCVGLWKVTTDLRRPKL